MENDDFLEEDKLLQKKKKKKDWIDEGGEDHPVHEKYTGEEPIKR